MSQNEDLFDSIDLDSMQSFMDEIGVDRAELETDNALEKTPPIAAPLTLVDTSAEEEEEEENPLGTDNSQDTGGTPEVGDDLLHSFTSALVESGVLSGVDLSKVKVKDVAALNELIKEQIKKQELAGLDEKQKAYLEAIRAGVPHEEAVPSVNNIAYLESITENTIEENAELRKNLIYRSFIAKGFDEQKALKYTERSIQLEEDIADAIEAKAILLDNEKAALNAKKEALKQQEEAAKKEESKVIEDLRKRVLDTDKEIIPGFKPTQQIAEKVFKSMTEAIATTEDGRPLNAVMKARMDNPIEFEHKLHYLFQITDGFKDFSYFKRVSKSKAVEEFEANLRKTGTGNMGGGKVPNYIDEDGSMEDLLAQAINIEKSL